MILRPTSLVESLLLFNTNLDTNFNMDLINLIHYSHNPNLKLDQCPYLERMKTRDLELIKPCGFWISVDDAWAQWCTGNNFPLGKYKYRVILKPSANILLVDTPEKIRDINRLTRSSPPGYRYWDVLAEKYKGVIFTPYIFNKEVRYRYTWYYSLDCSSGCIWDLDAVDRIELID